MLMLLWSRYVSFSDNQIYSWGRGDNGRLGIFTDTLSRTRGGIPCTAMPRPIFGSLQLVSHLSCVHWNSIIVAGKDKVIFYFILFTHILI